MDLAAVAAIIYGVLAFVGGVLGYVTAKSQMSLISGLISGILLIVGGIAHQQNTSWGLVLATVVTIVLLVVFTVRLFKTKKFMPAGLMVIAGILTLAALLIR